MFFGKVVRATGMARPIPPSRIARFVKDARQTAIGPHLAVMFHAAAHPDKEALVEYGEQGVRRLTWGEFDATINRLAQAMAARGVTGGKRVALMENADYNFKITFPRDLPLAEQVLDIRSGKERPKK